MADFLSSLQAFESGDARRPERGGSNIANTHEGTSSGQAQGFNQITTGTWKEFGGLAYAPTPLQATQEQQNAIAAKIPLKRWDPKTLAYLRNQGFSLNPGATLAENIALNHGTLGVATPPHSTAPGTTINTTSDAPVATAAPAAAPPAGQGLFGVGAGGQAQTDKVMANFSALDKALGGKGIGADAQQGGKSGAPEIQASPIIPGPGAHIPQPPQEPYGQTLNSVPELAGAPQQPQQQGGLSPQIMLMLQQLAAQQSPQFPGGLV